MVIPAIVLGCHRRTSCMRHNVRRHPRRRQGALSAARVTWYSMADRQGEYHQPTPMQWYVVDDSLLTAAVQPGAP